MARIAGVDLPNHKRIDIALTAIYGIGRRSALKIVEKTGIEGAKKTGDLSSDEINRIRKTIDGEGYVVEGDLRRDIQLSIKRLIDLANYRGMRHRKHLPCRGQRTKTNARTCKGPRRTIANKKK